MDFEERLDETLKKFSPLLDFSPENLKGWKLKKEGNKKEHKGAIYESEERTGKVLNLRINFESTMVSEKMIDDKCWPFAMDVEYMNKVMDKEEIQLVREIDEDTLIELQTKKLPLGVTNRQFVVLRKRIRVSPNKMLIIGTSVEVDEVPLNSDYVRGDAEFVTELEVSEDGKKIMMKSARCMCLNGKIPSVVVRKGSKMMWQKSCEFIEKINAYNAEE
eukprot:TRINITY_DN3827_c0_g1_i1.p1 TRINITY_DN3827_c0_g1~~TRINITY_DN3827_c0_g1_i1.p1  ORF type:complete len:218 (-),score=60.79 TRINITY_DN3827_c0_g1_i1:366-1019(-)